jgi:hypothetical protein
MKQIAVLSLAMLGASANLYNPAKTPIAVYGSKNFETQVTKNRAKGISIVQFYKKDDGRSKNEKSDYENMGLELKDMIRVGALDCGSFAKICDAEGVTTYPTYKVYPPFPVPVQTYEGDALDIAKLKKMATKHIGNRAIDINQSNHETFIEDDISTPKILLFTDKEKGYPLTFRALSVHFDKTLLFGVVRSTDAALIKKYKVKKFPSIVMKKTKDTKPIPYESEDFTYSEIFKFINVYSETFVFPGDAEVKESKASKPWMTEKVPELHGLSANDVCLKKDGALCVIYVSKDAASKDQAHLDMLYELGGNFQKQIHRGINFHFMWLDCATEAALCEVF